MRLALFSNVTTEFLKIELLTEFQQFNIDIEILIPGFNQYIQMILTSKPELMSFSPEFIFFFLDYQTLFSDALSAPFNSVTFNQQIIFSKLEEHFDVVKMVREKFPNAIIILNTCVLPPKTLLMGMEFNSEFSFSELEFYANQKIKSFALSSPSIKVFDSQRIANEIGYHQWEDARFYYMANSRWSKTALQSIAKDFRKFTQAILTPPKKCLVIDLDNTIWGGVLGEEGVHNIQLGESGKGLVFLEFQQELRKLKHKGVMLAIASKNNYEDVVEVFQKNKSMALQLEDFVSIKANWEDKAKNIAEIAQELNIGLDSFVFLDDNPVERDLVKTLLPMVVVPEMPTDPILYKETLLDINYEYFMSHDLTQEDTLRTEMYLSQKKRETARGKYENLDDYLKILEISVVIEQNQEKYLTRIAQLVKKTNQFNLTTIRYTEDEILKMLHSNEWDIFTIEVNDKFGKNGIVGVMIVKGIGDTTAVINSFILSCRVMSRKIENVFLAEVSKYIKTQGTHTLIGLFSPTKKNKPVEQLYPQLGFLQTEVVEGVEYWEFDLEQHSIPFPDWIESKVILE